MSDITPSHYHIHLEPDLERFRFEGTVEILLETDQPVGGITLNALDLAVWKCELVTELQRKLCSFTMDPKKEELRITLPDDSAGRISLVIRYTGEINNMMVAFIAG